MTLATNTIAEQPGLRLMDGSDINNIVASLNKASSAVNSLLAGGTTGTYKGSFNGTLGSSTPAAASVTSLTGSSNAAITGTLGVTGASTFGNVIRAIQTLTAASTGTSPTAQGILEILSSSAKNFLMGAPVIGSDVQIVNQAPGTASKKVRMAAGVSIFGASSVAVGSSTAKTSLNFTRKGQSWWLRAVSSAAYATVAFVGAPASS